jgi:uncharacterized protein (TIGR02300 family)
VAKPEWGTKRQCGKCDARFYDLNRSPATCPKCEAGIEVEVEEKPAAAPAPAKAETPQKGKKKEVEPVSTAEDDDFQTADKASDNEEDLIDLGDDAAPDDDKEDYLEDASELGEDEDDMAEVLESSSVDNKVEDR